MDLMASPWFWGFGGAFIYAAPRLSACLFSGRESGTFCRKCWLDCAFSVTIGPIAAAAFTASVQGWVSMPGIEHLPTVAATIGLLVNPLAPGGIEVLTTGVLHRLRSWISGDEK